MDPLQNQQGMAAALMQPQAQQPPPQNPSDLYVSMGEQQGSFNQPNDGKIVPDAYTPPQQMNPMMSGMYPQTNPLSGPQMTPGPLAGQQMPLNTNAQMPYPVSG